MENSYYRYVRWIISWLRRNLRIGKLYFPVLNIHPLIRAYIRVFMCLVKRLFACLCHRYCCLREVSLYSSETDATSIIASEKGKPNYETRRLYYISEKQESPRGLSSGTSSSRGRRNTQDAAWRHGFDRDGPLATASYAHYSLFAVRITGWQDVKRNLSRRIIIERTAGCDSLVASGWYTQRRAEVNGEELFK